MKKTMKTLSGVLYGIFALLSLICIFVGVGEVSESLDGWHDFSAFHSVVFVLICIAFALGAAFNLISIRKNVFTHSNSTAGILLFICPFLIHIIANLLKGNVDSDFQYLILRNFQGFDKTYLLLGITGIAAYVSMLLGKKQIAG